MYNVTKEIDESIYCLSDDNNPESAFESLKFWVSSELTRILTNLSPSQISRIVGLLSFNSPLRDYAWKDGERVSYGWDYDLAIETQTISAVKNKIAYNIHTVTIDIYDGDT